jgi:CubicO group peptidase (beta-lactamase class C family)
MKNRLFYGVFLFVLLTSFVSGHISPPEKKKEIKSGSTQKLDAIFKKSIVDFNVPGMAVAIVKDGKTILSKGYGVKHAVTKEKVDDHTQFAIASNTKAFTSAALAMLVDAGKIKWTDKVRDYLPYFKLYSPYVTEEITIADLLCHRSGLATFSGDLIWYGSEHSREEVVKRARYLVPTMGFRDGYGYSNIMFLAAGEIVSKVSGMSWDNFVKQKIFVPLGMTNTNTSIRDFRSDANIATPHNEVGGVNKPIDWVNWDNIGPAGSINSCVADMSWWLELQLGKGTLDEQVFWNEQRSYEMWENMTPKPISKWQRDHQPSRHFNGYGLGWELMEYGGYKIVSHGGGYDGMISKTVLVPELNLGFVILTNNISNLPTCLTFEILDEYLGVKQQNDWLQTFLTYKKEDALAEKRKLVDDEANRVKNTKPSLALDEYCGTYHCQMYGDVVVTKENSDHLKIDFKPTALFKGTLSHWHYDTFQLAWTTQMMLPTGMATFVLGANGKPTQLKVVVDNPDFDFTELKLMKK